MTSTTHAEANDASRTPMDLFIRGLVGLLLFSVGFGALVGLLMLITGDEGWIRWSLVTTALAVAGYTIGVLAAALLIRRGNSVVLMWLAILFCLVSVIVWSPLVWLDRHLGWEQEQIIAQSGGTTTIIVIGLLYTALYAMMKTKSVVLSVLRWGIIGLAWVFGCLFCFMLWFGESLERLLPMSVFLTIVTGTLATGGITAIGSLAIRVLFRVQERREKAGVESVLARPKLEMSCPKCGAEQTLPTGPARCTACGFTMIIEVEEPRCACGYLLFRLEGDRCPECGAAV